MERYDIFNGDADGICALHQLRMAEPAESQLVSGVKRDIQLLKQLVGVKQARVTVLDVSLDSNREALETLLKEGCEVQYFDHHFAGQIPDHPKLDAHIEVSPRVCTSLLVDHYLKSPFRAWSVTAAFGDNLVEVATEASRPLKLTSQELGGLRQLGELLNYNGYGDSLEDLHIAPIDLYQAIKPYQEPLEFLARAPEAEKLAKGFQEDMAQAETREAVLETEIGRVFRFPGEAWARRIIGIFANQMANENPYRATAMLVDDGNEGFRVSVRAPLASPTGADELCRLFPTGGGRPNAAGINYLAESELSRFLDDFQRVFEFDEPTG